MRVYKDIKSLPIFDNAVITVGSFDGVHHGHQKLLQQIIQLAHQNDGESVIITFDPHPREIVYPQANDLHILSDIDEKLRLFSKYDIDNVIIVPFTIEFSQLSPIEYVEDFLIRCFNPSYIVIGYDHRFGLNRAGNIDLLRSYETRFSLKLIEIPKQELDEITISSTKIRDALLDGNIDSANLYLNHFYTLKGKVIHGNKIGTKIDFPTANISYSHPKKLIPKEGVYAAIVKFDNKSYKSMLYIGKKPTLGSNMPKSIEVNIFDFNGNIYDEVIWIDFVAYIRSDIKFDSMQELRTQLFKDKKRSLEILEDVEIYNRSHSKITVSILNYNGKQLLEAYLPSVLYSSSNEIEIQVIDNGSSDDSVDYIKEWHPEVKLLQLGKNYGFSEGYNRGLREINTKYCAIINSDVSVSENWLDPIITLMESDDKIACCQPVIRSQENKSSFEYAGAAGGYMDILGFPFCKGRVLDEIEKDTGQYYNTTPDEVFWVSGAAMVVRTDIFKKYQGFDKDFFAHQEEIDFCWRVKRAGYKCMLVHDAIVYHVGGATLDYQNSNKLFLNIRNNLSMLVKNESWLRLFWILPIRLILDGFAGLVFLIKLQPKNTLAIIRAHFGFYGHFNKVIEKRKTIKKLISSSKLKNNSKVGRYDFSIIWKYYVMRKKKFSDL